MLDDVSMSSDNPWILPPEREQANHHRPQTPKVGQFPGAQNEEEKHSKPKD